MFNWLRREPKELIERRQALAPALADYPLYQPPDHPGPFLRRRHDQTEQDYMRYRDQYAVRSDENFRYFMDQRATRLAALKALLDRFGVSASLDDVGLASVSAWFADHSFALVGSVEDHAIVEAFYRMQTPWTEQLRSLNFIFDLGVFLGESLIKKQPRLHWKYLPGISDDGESFSTGYVIEGFRGNTKVHWYRPGEFILDCCIYNLRDLRSYSPRPSALRNRDVLVGQVRAYSTR